MSQTLKMLVLVTVSFDAGMRLINMVPYKELPEDQRSQISEADYNARNFIAVKN